MIDTEQHGTQAGMQESSHPAASVARSNPPPIDLCRRAAQRPLADRTSHVEYTLAELMAAQDLQPVHEK